MQPELNRGFLTIFEVDEVERLPISPVLNALAYLFSLVVVVIAIHLHRLPELIYLGRGNSWTVGISGAVAGTHTPDDRLVVIPSPGERSAGFLVSVELLGPDMDVHPILPGYPTPDASKEVHDSEYFLVALLPLKHRGLDFEAGAVDINGVVLVVVPVPHIKPVGYKLGIYCVDIEGIVPTLDFDAERPIT